MSGTVELMDNVLEAAMFGKAGELDALIRRGTTDSGMEERL
jgi:hypothetical protein